MKMIHCADLHLDSRMNSNLTGEKAKERKTELLGTFVRMVDFASEHDVRAILIAGDLFDTKRISALARNTVYETITSHPGILFFYLPGNHEEDAFLASIPSMPENLKTFGDSWTIYEGHNVTVAGAVMTGDNAGALYASLQEDPSRFNIVMLHGQIADYPSSGSDTPVIAVSELRDRNISYLALGHVHQHQEGKLPPSGIWCYPGCLEGRGFDETGEHGFVLLDIDTKALRVNTTFVPFARRRLYAPEVDVTGCMSTLQMIDRAGKVLDSPGAPGPDDLVKLVLTGEVDISCEKNPLLIDEHFAQDYYFFRTDDRTKLAVDYRDFALDASLKGEFVRTVQMDATLTEKEKAEVIRCGIQALSEEEIEV